MSWYSRRSYGWGGFASQMTVAERGGHRPRHHERARSGARRRQRPDSVPRFHRYSDNGEGEVGQARGAHDGEDLFVDGACRRKASEGTPGGFLQCRDGALSEVGRDHALLRLSRRRGLLQARGCRSLRHRCTARRRAGTVFYAARLRQGASQGTCAYRGRARLRTPRVVVPRLESTERRLLSFPLKCLFRCEMSVLKCDFAREYWIITVTVDGMLCFW